MTESEQPSREPADSPDTATSPDGDAGPGQASAPQEHHVLIVGPDGQPVGAIPASMIQAAEDDDEAEKHITELVEQPAKVMRIGGMIKSLLEEVRSAPLDEASRQRLKEIHTRSIHELETGLAPELVEELERLSLPFTEDGAPSESELRIAQAQLVGWLEGLFHGIQTAIYAQQMAARAQFEQIRRQLPGGHPAATGGPAPTPGPRPGGPDVPDSPGARPGESGGMYL